MRKTPQAPIAHNLGSTPSFDCSIPKCLLSCPSSTPLACALINSCLEADTSSFTDHSLAPPALLGLPPSRPYSPLSWMTLTASFCQSTLCVTGRTICFKNKCDQISPLPKNLETLLLPLEVTVSSHVVCSLPTGEHNGGGTQRVMLSALPGGLTHPRGSTALASLVVPVSGTTTAVHTGHWRRSCQQIVTVCTLGTVLFMLT